MYSGILIIVETSLSGLGGSGARQTSALERIRRMSSSPRQPANSTASAEAELGGERAHRLEHVAVADEDRVPVLAARAQVPERAQRVVDAVLRPHDPEVADQVRFARARSAGSGATGRKRSRSGPLRTTKTSSGACRRAATAIRR